jgi:hypothetical protein
MGEKTRGDGAVGVHTIGGESLLKGHSPEHPLDGGLSRQPRYKLMEGGSGPVDRVGIRDEG